MIGRAPALALSLGLLLLMPAAAADPSWSQDEEAVPATDEAFHTASLSRKVQAWKEFASYGAAVPNARGKDEIGSVYDKLYARPGFRLDWYPTYAKVVGDIAITSGPFERHIAGPSGTDQRSTGTYVTVWERRKDGSWRYVWDGGTQDP